MARPEPRGWHVRDADADADLDRLPPQDLEAEQAALGAVLMGGDAVKDVRAARLAPADCYRDAHRDILAAAYAVADTGEAVDVVSVATELRKVEQLAAVGDWDYLTRLVTSTPYAANARQYAAAVRACAVKRRAADAARLAATAIYDPLRTPAEAAELLRQAADAAAAEVTPAADTATTAAAYDAWATGTATVGYCLSTPWPSLNDALGGGLMRPDLYVVAAGSGVGKTALGCSLDYWVADHGEPVGVVSLEQTAGNLFARYVALGSDVPVTVLVRHGIPDAPCYRAQAVAAADRLRDQGRLHVVDKRACSGDLDDVCAHLRHLRETHGCKLLRVENFNNLTAAGHDSTAAMYDAIATRLDRLAADLNCPIVVLAQLGDRGDAAGKVSWSQQLQRLACLVVHLKRGDGETDGELLIRKLRDGDPRQSSVSLSGCPTTYRWTEAGCGQAPDVTSEAAPGEYDDDPFTEER